MESMMALGIVLLGFFVSSESLAILSNPIYAKKINAAAEKTPSKPFANSF